MTYSDLRELEKEDENRNAERLFEKTRVFRERENRGCSCAVTEILAVRVIEDSYYATSFLTRKHTVGEKYFSMDVCWGNYD